VAEVSATFPQGSRGSLEQLGGSAAFSGTLRTLVGRAAAVDPEGLERFAASDVDGTLLLRLLELSGWEVAVTTAFAGRQLELPLEGRQPEAPAKLVIVSRGGLSFQAVGATVGEVAPGLFVEAVRTQRLRLAA
jgi:hypothetical protein